ncbi:hypothetical protein PR048_020807 [Dryococelus australis]|uniref:Reverse transcriptase/retrotransposon-derived protein RNase H-like domain-containing protein n=1 Tax=Dryococelus australis TaxID=614101 RepID=A0ABQ9GWF6_9NEOP|nr:hypothetical protein PR048_020807 [Dryococelus australis]
MGVFSESDSSSGSHQPSKCFNLPVLVVDGVGPTLRNWCVFLSPDTSYAGMSNEAFSHTIMNLPAVSGHVAFSLTTKMEEAIAANVKRGEQIPVNHASPWASAIVPVLKRNGTLRLCADYKGMVNRTLSSHTYKSPTVDQVLSELAGGCMYGTIDLEEAYTQIPGTLFIVCTVLRGYPLVLSTTVAEYYARLLQILHILGDAGFKVNSDICVWQSASIEVLGFMLDAEGIHPNTDKTAATTNAPKLQFLLGLISFYGRFFKDKATILEPLHRLLDSKSKWAWTTKYQVALQMVKDMLTSHLVLAHYNPDLPLVVTADTSPVGAGAHRTRCSVWQNKRDTHCLRISNTDCHRASLPTARPGRTCYLIFPVKKFTLYLAYLLLTGQHHCIYIHEC